jgi:hypothetical protein
MAMSGDVRFGLKKLLAQALPDFHELTKPLGDASDADAPTESHDDAVPVKFQCQVAVGKQEPHQLVAA